jgi:hypothetical protein
MRGIAVFLMLLASLLLVGCGQRVAVQARGQSSVGIGIGSR